MTYIKCPECKVQYPLDRLRLKPEPGKRASISCVVCGRQVNVTFYRLWPLRVRAVVKLAVHVH